MLLCGGSHHLIGSQWWWRPPISDDDHYYSVVNLTGKRSIVISLWLDTTAQLWQLHGLVAAWCTATGLHSFGLLQCYIAIKIGLISAVYQLEMTSSFVPTTTPIQNDNGFVLKAKSEWAASTHTWAKGSKVLELVLREKSNHMCIMLTESCIDFNYHKYTRVWQTNIRFVT